MAKVQCIYFKKELEGLERAPWPGDLGQKVLKNVSKEAWGLWIKHQTMLINENRLNALEPKDRNFLAEELEKFFFGDGCELPQGYTPKAID